MRVTIHRQLGVQVTRLLGLSHHLHQRDITPCDLPQCSHRAEALGCHPTMHLIILHSCCNDKREAHIRETQAAEQIAASTPGIETPCNSSKSMSHSVAPSSPSRYAIVILSGKSRQDIVLHVMSARKQPWHFCRLRTSISAYDEVPFKDLSTDKIRPGPACSCPCALGCPASVSPRRGVACRVAVQSMHDSKRNRSRHAAAHFSR